jgi:hypothetical protein
MEKNSLRRGVAAAMGATLVASPLLALATPAFAAGCATTEPAATEVLPGVCEVQYFEYGDFTFDVPAGVTKLTAILVGAGGATDTTSGSYAGGGGAVVYVENVDISAPVDIYVGIGAQPGVARGEDTTVNSAVAAGGYSGNTTAPSGGASGNGNLGSFDGYTQGSGGGAGGNAVGATGGVGVTASSVANDPEIWPAVNDEIVYGAGGSDTPSNPGYGDYGWGGDGSGQRDYGFDGTVILRWVTGSKTLPATGTSLSQFAGLAAAFMIPGAALMAFALRSRRSRSAR